MADTPAVATIQNKIKWDHPAACHATIIDRAKGLVDWKGRTKFAIVGFASSSRDVAPYDDPEWVILALNQLYRHIDRADAWFDIHADADKPEKVVEGTDYVGWLKEAPIPIFMIDQRPEYPTSLRYPIEDAIALTGLDYFTSTISFMIALALRDGAKTIGLWGVDLIVGQEWDYQKACVEFWLGVAQGKGLDILLPNQTALLKTSYRYGYESEPTGGLLSMSEVIRRETEFAKKRQELIAQLNTLDGALQDCQYWKELMLLRSRGGSINIA